MSRKKKKSKIGYIIIFLIISIIGIISPQTIEKIDTLLDVNEVSQVENIDSNTINNNLENIKLIKENEASQIEIDKEKLNILFLDVGQADSELIFYQDKLMVIDTGNVEDGEKIIEFLKELNISKIDYLIGTHIHEDHIGSMQYFIKEFEIDKIYLPYNDTSVNTYYKNLLNEILNNNMQIEEIEVGNIININDVECEVMAVDNNNPENQNDASIVIEMRYKDNKFLFTGDATKKVEEKRNWNDIDVLKVGHHGSNTSSSEEFVSQVKPEVSIISVGKDNSYNLPKQNVIDVLKSKGSKIFRTDEDGTIQIISNGTDYEIITIKRSFDGNK